MNKVIAHKITEAICSYDGKTTCDFIRFYHRRMEIPVLNIARMKLMLRRMALGLNVK